LEGEGKDGVDLERAQTLRNQRRFLLASHLFLEELALRVSVVKVLPDLRERRDGLASDCGKGMQGLMRDILCVTHQQALEVALIED